MIVPQGLWRWKIAAYLFLAGTGAGSCIIAVLADFAGHSGLAKPALVFGTLMVVMSPVFLIWDLGRPGKFWLAARNLRTSWISRGFVILCALIVLAGLTILLSVWPLTILTAPTRFLVEGLALVAAVAACVYTGILIGIVIGRPFWNSPLLPLLFLISALSTGIAGVFLVTPLWLAATGTSIGESTADFMNLLGQIDLVLIALEGMAVYLYISAVFDRASEAARLLVRGKLARLFWIGFVAVGLGIPVAIESLALLFLTSSSDKAAASFIAAIFLLCGGYLLRSLFLAAGLRSPIHARVAFHVRPGA